MAWRFVAGICRRSVWPLAAYRGAVSELRGSECMDGRLMELALTPSGRITVRQITDSADSPPAAARKRAKSALRKKKP